MSNTRFHRELNWVTSAIMAILVVTISSVLGVGHASAADPPGSKTAARMVTTNGKMILGFAYPTAKKLDKIELDDTDQSRDGSFTLTYTVDYTDKDGDAAYVTLKFTFDKSGKMLGVKETSRSSFWPAFGTAKLVLEATKEIIRNDEKARNSPDGKKLLAIDEPTEFLAELLNLKAGK